MKKIVLIQIVFHLIRHVLLAPEHLFCAHLYNKVAHISIEQPDPDSIVGLDSDSSEIRGDEVITDVKFPRKQSTVLLVPSSNIVEGSMHFEKCDPSNFCYALWQTESNVNGSININIMGQGCWTSSDQNQNCERSDCVSDKRPPKAMNNTKFCCCSGNLCNLNFTDSYIPEVDSDPKILSPYYLESTRKETQNLIITVLCVCILIAAFACFILYRKWQSDLIESSVAKTNSVNLMENGPGFANGFYSVDNLKLSGIIGQGRYGCVWKGTLNEQDVAVKIFPAHYRNYFYNERDVYCLPFMDNQALLTYFGCDERINMDGHTEYLLVLSYARKGCLQDYLRANVLDWQTFCKMSYTVAKGLAHLHTDMMKGDKMKPCVSHRDLNTRNILVKNDLSCCLCDLGFAMKISGSKYYQNGEEQHAETKSINEVGTLRYMAPEVLEGAVNLRDCESSLKQIDVYALGLVLWELATRCSDLYPQGVDLLPYKLPFEAEVGIHPNLEQMQTLVSRHKARPLWPDSWSRWGLLHRLVRDTTEDCWDQDAEARLTALCVEERLHELSFAKDRSNRVTIYSSAISPSVNLTQTTIINNYHLNTTTVPSILPPSYQRDTIDNSVSQVSIGKDSLENSEGTVETMYTMSPSDAPSNDYIHKNSNQAAAHALQSSLLANQQSQNLQPFQGRNPCLERNLMIPASSTDDLCIGNTLIDKSFKHVSHRRTNPETQDLLSHDYSNQNGTIRSQVVTPVQNTGLHFHQNGSIGHPINGLNRPATPIPYVQNVVYDSNAVNSYAVVPKQQNITGNNLELNLVSERELQKNNKFGWISLKRLIDKKIFGRERLESISNEETETKSNLVSKENLLQNSKKMIIGPLIMETRVNLIPGKTVNSFVKRSSGDVITSVLNGNQTNSDINKSNRRPSTLPLVKVKPLKFSTGEDKIPSPMSTDQSEISIENKMLIRDESNPLRHRKFTIVPSPNESSNNMAVDENEISVDNSFIDESARLVPKTTKPSKIASGISQVVKRRKCPSRENSLEQFDEVFSSTSDISRLKDPNQRIKTPGDVPPSVRRNRGRAHSNNSVRFSLYDDRMMTVDGFEEGNIEPSWSSSVPDRIGITENHKNVKPGKIDISLSAVRADSVSSF